MPSHSQKTASQFGSSAAAYLSSAVHSQGADLDALAEKAERIEAKEVLDLGCGAGHVSFALARRTQSVVAYDLSHEMLKVVEDEAHRRGLENISVQQGEVEHLPFADKSFDVVCTRYSAHHWLQIEKALSEIYRVLRPGGTCVVVDTCSTGRPLLDTHLQAIELFRDASHVRNYSLAEWAGKLESTGFQLQSYKSWRIRLEFEAWVKRMQTPASHVEALKSLMSNAPEEVRQFFEIAEDGSFSPETMMIDATRPSY